MYDQFYGFTGRPFQLTPDPHFYFESGTHRRAMSYLGYGLAQGEGIIVITGETGTGKSTLVGHLLSTIETSRINAVKLVATQVEGDDLLALTAEQFGLDFYGEDPAQMLKGVEIYLRSHARAGRRTLLVVDEAQKLSLAALEQLAQLSSLQVGDQPLLQIFLLGHPEIRHTLSRHASISSLRLRVIATHHLDPMEPEEVEPYIFHRLGKVGWHGNPSISPDAFEQFYQHSEGVPRRLNALVTKVLMFAALDELPRITGQNIRDVVAESEAATAIGQAAAQQAAAPAVDGPPALEIVEVTEGVEADEAEEAAAEPAVLAPQYAAQEDVAALRQQISQLESRLQEQDAALRRVIDLMLNWVEPQETAAQAAREAQASQSQAATDASITDWQEDTEFSPASARAGKIWAA